MKGLASEDKRRLTGGSSVLEVCYTLMCNTNPCLLYNVWSFVFVRCLQLISFCDVFVLSLNRSIVSYNVWSFVACNLSHCFFCLQQTENIWTFHSETTNVKQLDLS